MQHPQMLHEKCDHFQTRTNNTQHVATGWPNARKCCTQQCCDHCWVEMLRLFGQGFFRTDMFYFTLCMLQLALVLIAVFAVVVYRAAVYAVLAAQHNYNMGAVSIATSGTAALINLIIIMLLYKVLEFPCICPL